MFNNMIVEIAADEEAMLKVNYSMKKKFYNTASKDPYDIEINKIENLMFKIKDPIMLGSDTTEEWRERYYKHYYNVEKEEIVEFSKNMTFHYMRGLKWITQYYFDECPSWNWYYPYDHPPLLHDMVDCLVDFNKIKFTLGEPLKPYEQLLCVLPKQSSYLLPKCLQKIMLN